jgi:hypothetical protein
VPRKVQEFFYVHFLFCYSIKYIFFFLTFSDWLIVKFLVWPCWLDRAINMGHRSQWREQLANISFTAHTILWTS